MGWRIAGLEPKQWRKAGEILDLLGERYQILRAHPVKPLAIGTNDHLVRSAGDMGLTQDDIKFAMIRHTRSLSYLTAVALGGARYNLDGEVEGEVQPSQARFSRITIDRRRAREAAASARRRLGNNAGRAGTATEAEAETGAHAKIVDRAESEVEAIGNISIRPPDSGDPSQEAHRSDTEDRAA